MFGLSLLVSSTAAAVRTEYFGIAQQTLDQQDLDRMAAARVRTDRFELGWRFLEPSQGSFSWRESDPLIGALAAHGIRSVPFVFGSPQWVTSKPAIPPVDTAAHEQAWQDFLKAAVARYGPGGTYWTGKFRERYGGAKPLPIQSWQVWNEPNLTRRFNPGGTDQQSVQKYARLLRISHEAIKSQDPKARIVLAGNPGYPPGGGLRAWEFLEGLYRATAKSYFDVAALHPYASTIDLLTFEIQKVRGVMRSYGDQDTPLWLTELGWGSAPRDSDGINKGLLGQQRMLRYSFKRILNNRSTWNLQRLFWFMWRDPAPKSALANRCSFCGSAGLLRHDRTKKPAFFTFKGFTAETIPPVASITSGPSAGGVTNDPTPTFTFASNERGSTFQCRVGANSFKACSSPFTTGRFSDGAHSFSVRAIDAPGNVSAVVKRSFTVDATTP